MTVKPINILHADDDVDDCNFFKDALTALPVKTRLKTVNDGDELMNYLSNNTDNLPDVLFLDINMPRKNGFECLSEITNNLLYKNLVIIVLSTSNSREKIQKIFKIGGHIYIRKPNDFGQIKQIIQNVLPIALEHVFSKKPLNYILNA
jgi:CheY-like chemotaxis protein